MPNGSDSALGLTRDAATASDAQPEKPSARAPWQGRYPSNGQANGVRSNGSGLVPGELKAQGDTPTFRDRARTVLPVEYQGREVVFEAHAYEDDSASYQALALVYRGTSPSSADELPLVRVHSGCATGDIFHSLRCDCHAQLQKAIGRVIKSRIGAIIYLPHHEGRGIDTVDANLSIGAPVDARDYTLAAKILKDLGLTEIRLLTNNPLKVEALQRLGIKVAEQIQHATSPSRYNARYLATKRERMAHKL